MDTILLMNSKQLMVAAFLLVSLIWWIAAWIWPSPLNSDISPVREMLALMGLCFLLGGAAALLLYRSSWALIFVLYCSTAAMHWAGPLGANQGSLDTLLLVIYVLIAVLLFACTFLHMAMLFQKSHLTRKQLLFTYLPLFVGFILCVAVFAGVVAEDAITLLFVVGSIYGFLAGLVWLNRLWVSRSIDIGFRNAGFISVALILAWGPNMLVQTSLVSLGVYNGVTNLGSLIMLVGFYFLANKSREPLSHGQ